MNTALIVACIAGAVALVSAAFSGWTQFTLSNRQRRSKAKAVFDRCRGPLLDAAWQLGDRLDNIRNSNFFVYLSEGSDREQDAKLTTLFRFAYYLGWREFVRIQVQLLRFEDNKQTRLVAGFLNDVTWIFASDGLDEGWAMLWGDEQRGIGELMIEPKSGASIVRGHASFHRDYKEVFVPWMERFADDLFSPKAAVASDRLRFLQWALYGLVRQLDEEGAYHSGWMDRSAGEIRQQAQQGSPTKYWKQLKQHLDMISSRPAWWHVRRPGRQTA